MRLSLSDGDEDEDPWLLPPTRKKKEEPIQQPLPARVRVTISNLAYIEKTDLPSAMLNHLMRLAAFQNPEFYRAQAMRLSIFGKPRVIRCAEEFPGHLGLPRGCLQDAIELLQSHQVKVDLDDERFNGLLLDVAFHGELRLEQQKSAEALLAHDTGIEAERLRHTIFPCWINRTILADARVSEESSATPRGGGKFLRKPPRLVVPLAN